MKSGTLKSLRALVLVWCGLQGMADPVQAEQIMLPASKDTTLYFEADDQSNGAGFYFFAGKNNSGWPRRGLLAFDVAESLPAGATIQSVSLQLYMTRTQAGGHTVNLYRLNSDWGESTGHAPAQEGGGGNAAFGDATWVYRFFNPGNPPASTAWTNPGGDFVGPASAGIVVAGTGYYVWGSTPALVANVQSWLDNPLSNFGWIIIGNEGPFKTTKRFASRTHTDPTRRPMLTVVFTPPPATGACCESNGNCQVLTQAGCASTKGTYQGDETSCTPNPCPQPTGACCLGDASCQVLTLGECLIQTGLYQGDDTPCQPMTCPLPTGACCHHHGTCVESTQPDCLLNAGTYQGHNVECAFDLCTVHLTPFVDPLPIPLIAQPLVGEPGGESSYEIAMRQFEQQLHRDLPLTTVWGYGDGPTGGSYPGPTILATSGVPVTVKWTNDLRDSQGNLRTDHILDVDLCAHGAEDLPKSVVHLHGGHVPPDSDGYPEATILPGEEVSYHYPNHQLPSMLWYHDHSLGITRLNVQMGLAGAYWIRDDVEDALNLPGGEFHVPLIVQDRTFNSDGSFRYHSMGHDHFFGDKMLVNGVVWPYLNVRQGKYRFRLLNGCNARVLSFSLSNGQDFQQIGTDGGLLPAPVTLNSVPLGPGERADLIMDFALLPAGTEIVLTNSAPAPFPGSPGEGVVPDVLKFIVQDLPGHTDALPTSLRPLTLLDECDAAVSRDMNLQMMPESCAGAMWMINELEWDVISEFPLLGSVEVWRFINRSGVSHPMHLHLVMFQVLDRQDFQMVDDEIVPVGSPVPPDAHEAGWKDTVLCHPEQITRVIARFEDYTGLFPYHCHILEHEDHAMMRQFQVVECNGDSDCDDDDDCTADFCDLGSCAAMPVLILFGDVAPQPVGNGVIDVDDVIYILDAFVSPLPLAGADIEPCDGDGDVDVDDIVTELGIFVGESPCPDPCPLRTEKHFDRRPIRR